MTRTRGRDDLQRQRRAEARRACLGAAALATLMRLVDRLRFVCRQACGKKGPPLPPLVKLPVAPENLVAERRGNIVDLQFTVPGTNTDGTRPANVSPCRGLRDYGSADRPRR